MTGKARSRHRAWSGLSKGSADVIHLRFISRHLLENLHFTVFILRFLHFNRHRCVYKVPKRVLFLRLTINLLVTEVGPAEMTACEIQKHSRLWREDTGDANSSKCSLSSGCRTPRLGQLDASKRQEPPDALENYLPGTVLELTYVQKKDCAFC